MSIFHGATDVAILGGTQVAIGPGSTVTINQGGQAGASSAFKDLSAAAAHTALHNSAARFDAPRCYRNTRAKYLNKLELWMLGQGEELKEKRVVWLHGGAGAGKSAIMQSIVERCSRHAVILGAFFFSRIDPSRNHPEVLIPTLAYQLARMFPAAMAILEPIINCDPLVFKASLRTQAHELLVRPILYLIETGAINQKASPFRRVFVVDGLDECSDPQKQALIINVVAAILHDYHVPVCFLLASRTEVSIIRAIQREKELSSMFASISLDHDIDAWSDIRQFIEDSFLDIVDNHPLRNHITLPWPNPFSIGELARKASGHFIYAATAMRFIASSDEHPAHALQIVEGLAPSRHGTGSPFGELDALYLHILRSSKYTSQVIGILRHCILTSFEPSVAAVCCIYDISKEDVALFLSDVQSLVSLSPKSATELSINLKHASLKDFLADEKRSQEIFITAIEYNASFLVRYFQLLDDGAQAPISSLFNTDSWIGTMRNFITALCLAINYSREIGLLQLMIRGHSPRDIWTFCMGGFEPDTTTSKKEAGRTIIDSVSRYIHAVRNSISNVDNALYIHQFAMYIQLLLDPLSPLMQAKPQYRIILALMLSSSRSGLVFLQSLIYHLGRQFDIAIDYSIIFLYLRKDPSGEIDLRSFKAIRHLPQTQLSGGSSDLAMAMTLVLRELVHLSWTPESLCANIHRRWLQRNKPWKQISLGSPKLTSTFYSFLRTLPSPPRYSSHGYFAFMRHGYSHTRQRKISGRRTRCFLLLKAVIFYLHKSGCTGEVVKLARRSLPKAALWFPGLLREARMKMDSYVLRWEESADGILAAVQSMSINDLD